VQGIVQGVGFRPFVYNLAVSLGLSGFVLNTTACVVIEVEGDFGAVQRFRDELTSRAPVLAQVDRIMESTLEAAGYRDFEIRKSAGDREQLVLVPPDIATCDDCRRDLTDPANRRFRYPFTNCTNCGPRYTITRDIPYDRPSTTMSEFPMCAACQSEYENPADRRFHAQPNACPVCGPWVELWDRDKPVAARGEALGRAVALLREGHIIAIKGLGGFHLACDAANNAAVRQLRERKRRTDKPFAVMVRDLEAAGRICVLSDAERAILSGIRRPIVILPRRADSGVSPAVAPNNRTIGMMLPYTPLHHLLFEPTAGEQPFLAVVMTSGNLSEEPIAAHNDEALSRLRELADFFLLHNREIHTRADDSVVRTLGGQDLVLRRSRGWVPQPIDLGLDLPEVLACGGELKSTFCLTKGHYAILSQHIGDLENYETLQFFEETLDKMKRFYRVTPRRVAHDLHPDYLSTRLAQSLEGVELIGVQHHHAHIASCMAENHLSGKVIGVALDGTGYGVDGAIWGGEFLVCDFTAFERRAYLRYVSLPGGDAAIHEPWRMALSYLLDAFGEIEPDLPPFREVAEPRRRFVEAMLRRGVSVVRTSSCGRLFDAVASLIGLRHVVNYEGQAAIELEMLASGGEARGYPFELSGDPLQVDLREMTRALVADVRKGVSSTAISARFHRTVADVVVQVCRRIRREEGLKRVCLSGGTFQNMVLLTAVTSSLERDGFEVFPHRKVPPNDGGLSLGQAVIAAAR